MHLPFQTCLLIPFGLLGIVTAAGAGQTPEIVFVELQQDGINGVDGLNGAAAVAVSPDGRHVVAAGSFENALAVFQRLPATGILTFTESVRTGGLEAVSGFAFSPVSGRQKVP